MQFLAQLNWAQLREINKLHLSQKWQGQSDFINIHAVHADRALLPSKP